MNSVDTCVLVVPCFNEAARLDPAPFLGMLQARAGLSLLFVDDGSMDGTRAALAGYDDADLATPPAEMLEIIRQLEERAVQAAIGSRVARLGRRIERRAARHYLGRVFATPAPAALQLPGYDTQCGAEVFRAGPALTAALAEPFISRWPFDVEIIGRLPGSPGFASESALDHRGPPARVARRRRIEASRHAHGGDAG